MNGLVRRLFGESALIPVASVAIGLLLGAVIMLAGSYNPILAYGSLFSRAFGDMYNLGETIRQITPYIFTGLSVAFAFRSGLFNIGAEGQFIMGAVAAAAVGVLIELPWYTHVPLALIASALAGGLWGAIVGWLKAARGVHEVITTIMLNWIALHLANYIVRSALLEKGMARSRYIHESAWLSNPDLTGLFDNARIHYGILIALVLAALFRFLLWKTKQGFEFRAVGFNPDASEYAGINVKSTFVKAMFISGLFAGVGGACEVLGVFHYQTVSSAFPGYGLMGIAVALIGRNSAVGVVLGAVLIGVLTYGASGMKFGAGVPEELIHVVIALVIFFVAASGIVEWMVRRFRNRNGVVHGHDDASGGR